MSGITAVAAIVAAVSIAYASQDFPAGTTADRLQLTLTETTTGKTYVGAAAPDAAEVDVPDVPAGTYAGSLALLDPHDNVLGAAIQATGTLTIASPATVTIQVPVAFALALK